MRIGGIVPAVVPAAITREIEIDAPVDVVWAIVTEARHLAGWFSDEAEIELRPGGAMLLTWRGHGTYRARVETVEVPATFAFRWVLRDGEEPVQGGSTLVVMTLTPTDTGTRLRVVESGFSDLSWPEHERARYAGQNADGWIRELDELRAYAARITASRDTR
ncbi:MAG TPA: SRPBCC domain-containing protein [Solirubrobacteraceae bacterium]